MENAAQRIPAKNIQGSSFSSGTALDNLAANELVFAVVGPVGSGTSRIAEQLESLLKGMGYDAVILKARDVIESEADDGTSASRPGLSVAVALQDAGDRIRKNRNDNAAVAVGLVQRIRSERAKMLEVELVAKMPVEPNGKKRAYVLDSIRHPQEVSLLRRVYQEAFCLVGVFCQEEERLRRLQSEKYRDAGEDDIRNFMDRDENAPEDHGQRVAEAFHLSDYFVDNTEPGPESKAGNKESISEVPEQLGRLVDILTHTRIIRPRPEETGMFHAYGARMQSSCLSRQVGAALLDSSGAVIATGTNEVPRAGGGVYGGVFSVDNHNSDPEPSDDFRCFVHNRSCTNTKEQNEIITQLVDSVVELTGSADADGLESRIRRSRIGQLLEFSRAVHAEMDALLSAARNGIKTTGTRLFVTTFPCHSCARHIVAAGVEEVQYIEPYLKSKAIPLHGDAIVTKRDRPVLSSSENESSAKIRNVLFRAFIGVAPRLYRRAFLKDFPLKDRITGKMINRVQNTLGHASTDAMQVSYAEVEARLSSPPFGDEA